MNGEGFAIAGAVAVLVATVYFISPPARTVNGETAIPTQTALSFIAKKDQADASVKINNRWLFDLYDGQLREQPAQAAERASAGFVIEQTDYHSFIEPAYRFRFDDFGAFYAAGRNHGGIAGIRVSPARLGYGLAAPDALIGMHDVGCGVSFYAPSGILGRWSRHCGVGFGHLWATDTGDSANVFYLAFSTHY
jgi:hypothetical protein